MTVTTPTITTVWPEAAHAVTVYLHGGRLVYVSALPSSDRWGGVCTWKYGDDELDAIAEAVVALAGPTAEALYGKYGIGEGLGHDQEPGDTGAHLHEHAGIRVSMVAERVATSWDLSDNPSDEDRVRQQVGRLALSERETHALTCWLKVRTVEFLRTPRCRHLLGRLTRALVRHGHLTGEAATAELARADREFTRGNSAPSPPRPRGRGTGGRLLRPASMVTPGVTASLSDTGGMVHMPAERRVSDEDLARLRELWAAGWSARDLAAELHISARHASRLARGDQRAPLGEPDVEQEHGGVAEAVAGFLSDAELSAADQYSRRRRAPWPGSSTRARGRIRRRRRRRRLGSRLSWWMCSAGCAMACRASRTRSTCCASGARFGYGPPRHVAARRRTSLTCRRTERMQ